MNPGNVFERNYIGGVQLEFQVGEPPRTATALPWSPLWLGLIANSAIYGTVRGS